MKSEVERHQSVGISKIHETRIKRTQASPLRWRTDESRVQCAGGTSHRLQLRVCQHQPFAPAAGEVTLHARGAALAFKIGDHALAVGGVHDALAELQTARRGFGDAAVAHYGGWARDMRARPHLLQ